MNENENEEENSTEENFYFNGINGDSGEYDLPPMTGSELYSLIIGEEEPENINELRYRQQQGVSSHLGVREGIDPKVLGGDDGAGWGVIFHRDADPAIKEAMSELLALREEQAGERFRLYEGGTGFRPQDSKTKFLARHKAGPGPADPEVVPYYLLIVGSPAEIPYRFQTQLDVDYAVGRIHFDTLDEYANYARSVVDAEKGRVKLPREMSFFGVANDGDRATQLSSQNLVLPVQKKLQGEYQDWRYSAFMGDGAIKKNLAALLGGEKTPALLFSASHGMSFPIESKRQLDHQGAILCQDWPGPREWEGAISQDHYFAGDDLSSDANLLGLVAFFFACYGAGTPRYDEFSKLSKRGRKAIVPNPFMAKLPEKMLGHPNGGALAVIGHVERAWGYSFMWPKAGKQTAVFEDTLLRLMGDYPVGAAVEFFNDRYATLSTVLVDTIEEIQEGGMEEDPFEMAELWTSNNDARGYAIIGDPAVRLPVASEGEEGQERPVISVQPVEAKSTRPTVEEDDEQAAVEIGESMGEKVAGFDEVSFALDLERNSLADSLKEFTAELARSISKAADDISSLEIATYSSDDLEAVSYDYESKKFSRGVKLQALTRIAFDGDTQICVPETDKGVNRELWQIHLDMVKQSQANRTAFLQSMAELAARLIDILNP